MKKKTLASQSSQYEKEQKKCSEFQNKTGHPEEEKENKTNTSQIRIKKRASFTEMPRQRPHDAVDMRTAA